MVRGRLFISAVIVFGLSGCGANAPSEFKIPAETASLKNPVPATPESIGEGERRYKNSDCSICHGKNGDGKGFDAKDLNMNLHDWRNPSVQIGFRDGELFYIMDQGKGTGRGRMPAYHDRETPEQIWHMVNYIRAFVRE